MRRFLGRKDQYRYRVEYEESHAVIYFKCKGEFVPCKVDIEDVKKVLSFPNTWYAHIETSGLMYVQSYLRKRSGKKMCVKLHRLLLQEPDKKFVVDHINHDTMDNQKGNLRLATKRENCQNLRLGRGKSPIIGVLWSKAAQKWIGRINVGGKAIHLGTFCSQEEAEKTVIKARAEMLPHSLESYASRRSKAE